MMYLIDKITVKPPELQIDETSAQFRKATLNMKMAYQACNSLMSQLPEIDKDKIVTLFGTHFGEVESTLDFLSTYRKSNIPRPILFQNSLHNSTLGFVSIQLQLKGPGLTISSDSLTVKSLICSLSSFLKIYPYALVCIVDYIPEKLVSNYINEHPFLINHLNQAKAFLFSSSKNLNFNLKKTPTEIVSLNEDFFINV